MKQLLIIGARGWGREVYDIAKECIKSGKNYEIKGFLDDKFDALKNHENYPPIVSSTEDYVVQPNDVFICALGDPQYKKKYAQIIMNKGGQFLSLIHPTAIIGTNSKIGYGCIIGAYSNLSNDTIIGNFVTFSIRSGIGHDSIVGDYSHIGGSTNISGYVKIGSNVTIHPCCDIIPHRNIGSDSVVGTGSVVITNVKNGITVFGNPAKEIKI